MPVPTQNSPAKNQASTATANADVFKFEVSAPQVFHFVFHSTADKVQLDLGAGQVSKSVAVPIPGFVQKTAGSVYSFSAPYVKWGYDKVLGATAAKQA